MAKIDEVSASIGRLLSSVESLGRSLDQDRDDNRQEHEGTRKVIAALSESVRALASDVRAFSAELAQVQVANRVVRSDVDGLMTAHSEIRGATKAAKALWVIVFALSGACGGVALKVFERVAG